MLKRVQASYFTASDWVWRPLLLQFARRQVYIYIFLKKSNFRVTGRQDHARHYKSGKEQHRMIVRYRQYISEELPLLCDDASTGIQTICPPEHKGGVCTTSRCRRLAGRPKGVLPWGRGGGGDRAERCRGRVCGRMRVQVKIGLRWGGLSSLDCLDVGVPEVAEDLSGSAF